MNRIAYTAFVAFWASLVTLLAFAFLADRPGSGPERAHEAPSDAVPGPREAEHPEAGELRSISMGELARHDDRESCWKAIHGKVYDVTDFIDAHPTPPSVMLAWCGRESTEAWEDKGSGRPHSQRAERMLEAYLVGTLDASSASR